VLLAASHRGRRELGLRRIAADHEHEEVLLAGLIEGDVHEAPRDAGREGDHIVAIEIDVLHRVALVPFAAPTARQRDERLVGIVVVH
jgi:hypothetical protein